MASKGLLLCRNCVREIVRHSIYRSSTAPVSLLPRKQNTYLCDRGHYYALKSRSLATSTGDSPKPDDTSSKRREGGQCVLHLSDSCVKQLLTVTADEEDRSFLRVVVEGGGCSGFQYVFKLDTNQEDDDRFFEKGGVKVVVDEASLELLDGSTIDYQEELIKSAFAVVDNPRAEMGCSCGVSFSLKL